MRGEREREREMWSRVVGVSVGAATAYAVTDALDELCLYLHCKRYEALSLSLSLSLCVCVCVCSFLYGEGDARDDDREVPSGKC